MEQYFQLISYRSLYYGQDKGMADKGVEDRSIEDRMVEDMVVEGKRVKT